MTILVKFDFYHAWDKKRTHRIMGSTPIRSKEVAEKVIELLNYAHGDNTHWIEEELDWNPADASPYAPI